MQKTAALLLADLLLLTIAASADESKGLAGYGPKTGFGLTNVCGRDSESQFKLGFVLGAFGIYRFNRLLALQAELQYVQKGSRDTGDFFPDYRERFALDYLELGILARLSLGSGSRRYHFLGGPAFALRLCGSFRAEWDGGSYSDDDMSDYRGFDLGLALGAGLSFPFGPGRLMFDLRTTIGLLDIYKESDQPYTNHAILFVIGYLFGGR